MTVVITIEITGKEEQILNTLAESVGTTPEEYAIDSLSDSLQVQAEAFEDDREERMMA